MLYQSFYPEWVELAIVELGTRAASCWVAAYRLGDVNHIGDHYEDY